MTWLLLGLGSCLLIYEGFVLLSAWAFSRAKTRKNSLSSQGQMVSVVIPFRDEALHLEDLLRSLESQTYDFTCWELILIDDHSSDRGANVVQAWEDRLPLTLLTNEGEGKKQALQTGIAFARGEIILQTDADVWLPKEWIACMVAQFEETTALVSGPVFLDPLGRWFGKLQSLESMGLVVLGAAGILRGKPNMCNGANLAYRKAVFEEVHGFEGVDQVASGDDELLLQKIHRLGTYPLTFAKDPRAIVRTVVQRDWEAFRAQRLRWVSKVRAYPDKRVNQIQLIAYLGFWSIPLTALAGFVSIKWWAMTLVLLLSKMLADIVLMYLAARFFHNLRMLKSMLWLELLYIPYVLWIGIAGNLVQTYQWKGRTVT